MRRVAGVVAATLALLIAAGVFGPDLLKGRVAQAAQRALHREVAIGNLVLLPSWPPTVQASGITVAGLGSVPRLRAQLAPDSLLTGRDYVRTVSLLRPTLMLQPDAQGRFVLVPRHASAGAAPAPASRRTGSDKPPRIVVQDGTLVLRDPRIGPDVTLAISGERDGEAYDFKLHGVVPAGTKLPWLTGMEVAAQVAAGRPVHATLRGSLHGVPVRAVIDTGTPEAIAARAGLPVTLTAMGAGVTLHASGQVGDLASGSGLDVALSLHADDERRLAALLAWPQSAAGPVSLDAQVTGGSGAYTLHALSLHAPQGDLAGDVALTLRPRPAVRGALHSQRLDLDAMLAVLATPPAAAAPTTEPPRPPAPARWVIPDRPLPFGSLGRADADLTLAAATLHFGGADYRDLAGHLTLQAGGLTLDPFTATLPGGGRLDATAHRNGNAASLTLHAPGISVAPTLAALHLPALASGQATLDADLHAVGATPHELASTLEGTASLHLGEGAVDGALLAPFLHAAHLPAKLLAGQARVPCAAVGFVAHGGVLDVAPLVVDADKLRVEGAGRVDLARETLALQLQPLLRSSVGLVIPVQVAGPWRAPKVVVGAGPMLPASTVCPSPAPTAASLSPSGRKHPKPIDLLRALLR